MCLRTMTPVLALLVAALAGGTAAAQISGTSLTFTTANWSTPQTIQVNGSLEGSGTITVSAPNQTSRSVGVSVAAGFCAK